MNTLYTNRHNYHKAPAMAALCLLLFSFLFTGCIDEAPVNGEPDEDFMGITLLIPNLDGNLFSSSVRSGETRGYDTSKETDFSNFYILAFDNNGNKVNTFNNLRSYGTTDDGYTIYRIALSEGSYRFYVLANIDDYVSGGVNSLNNEYTVKNLSLTFTQNKILEPGNLPMACFHENLKINGVTQGSGAITIPTTNDYPIKADLTYLCAKVRYTILYDDRVGGFSKPSFEGNSIRFDFENDIQPFAGNMGSQTSLNETYNEISDLITNANFFTWPDSSNGWSIRAYGWESHVAEFYNTYKFDFNQTISQTLNDVTSGMKKGYYKLEVQGFFRNGPGTWDLENQGYNSRALPRHLDGREQLLVKLYISDNSNNAEVPLKSLYSETCLIPTQGQTYPNQDYPYPDQMISCNTAFNTEDKYHNSVTFYHSGNDPIKIGLKREEESERLNGDWTCFDNFRLYYKDSQSTDPSGFNWNIPLDKYTFDWTATQYPEYPVNPEYTLTSWTGSDLSEWSSKNCKAWQGIAYLPENTNADNSQKTVLHFPFTYGTSSDKFGEKTLVLFGQNEDSDPKDKWQGTSVTQGIERGKMYDVVIRITEDDGVFTVIVNDFEPESGPRDVEW